MNNASGIPSEVEDWFINVNEKKVVLTVLLNQPVTLKMNKNK